MNKRPDELFARSYREVAAEIRRRYGWKIGYRRVFQICKNAEKKIKKALEQK